MAIKFPEPVTLSSSAAMDMLDKAADRLLGCTGQEFLRRWDAGEYHSTDSAAVAELSALIPYIR